jgi:hypothetical protein
METSMTRHFKAGRCAFILAGLVLAAIVPATAGDLAGWSDGEVNVALAEARLAAASGLDAVRPLCAGTTGDTASAIDCEVNLALIEPGMPAPQPAGVVAAAMSK